MALHILRKEEKQILKKILSLSPFYLPLFLKPEHLRQCWIEPEAQKYLGMTSEYLWTGTRHEHPNWNEIAVYKELRIDFVVWLLQFRRSKNQTHIHTHMTERIWMNFYRLIKIATNERHSFQSHSRNSRSQFLRFHQVPNSASISSIRNSLFIICHRHPDSRAVTTTHQCS